MVTLEEAVFKICDKHPWTQRWALLGELAITTTDRTWSTRDPSDECPENIQKLGCRGLSLDGLTYWVGWDFDVGHGPQSYKTSASAIFAAKRLKKVINGYVEIRHSKGGLGVHVRNLFEEPFELDGAEYAKKIAKKASVKVCKSALGRQLLDFWCRTPNEDSFKEIQ